MLMNYDQYLESEPLRVAIANIEHILMFNDHKASISSILAGTWYDALKLVLENDQQCTYFGEALARLFKEAREYFPIAVENPAESY